MGRPRRKKKVILVTYNISVETRDQLDKLKQKGENQNDVTERLLSERENIQSLKQVLADYDELARDNSETMRALRKKIAILELRLREKNQMDIISILPRFF